MLSQPLSFPAGRGPGWESGVARRVYSGAYLAQVADSHPAPAGDARVVNLNPATVAVTDTAVVARVGDVDWVWLLAELEEVVHGGDEPWTILAVPGVADHGVSVSRSDASDFRAALAGLLPGSARVRQLRSVEPAQPLPPPGHTWDAPAPRLPTPLVDGPARSPFDSQLGATTAPQPMVERRGPVPEPAAAPRLRPETALSRPPPLPPRHGGVDAPPISVERHRSSPIPGPSSSLAALDARSISAWFGGHQVLDQVSLEMAAGEVTALIGPSGCGKSTFLRILNRMHELIPSASLAGEVLLEGQDIYDPSRKVIDARRQIGMVFQKPNPFPAMSIYDNVVASFKLTGRKATSDEKDDVVESCLRKAGLWNEVRERLRQPGGGLSGGQQQRLCIARALAIRPRVLLMDEPCSALDPTSTRRIEQTISELKSEVTIVIVTHNMQQAARVSDQCAFFLAEQGTPGAIVEHGPTEDMFNAPQDRRTSDYVNGRFG